MDFRTTKYQLLRVFFAHIFPHGNEVVLFKMETESCIEEWNGIIDDRDGAD